MFDLRMPDVNTILMAGNLTRDPVFRRTTNGTPVTNFGIASNRRFKDNNGQWRENVCYVGVVAWYKLAENCAANLHRGSAVVIEGELQSRSIRTTDGRNRNIVEIKARRVQFLNKREETAEEEVETPSVGDAESSKSETKMVEETTKEQTEEKPDEDNPLRGKYDFGYQNLQL